MIRGSCEIAFEETKTEVISRVCQICQVSCKCASGDVLVIRGSCEIAFEEIKTELISRVCQICQVSCKCASCKYT